MEILKRIWRVWKKFGEFMGEIVGGVFLVLFYLTISLPFGVGVRLFGDPLDTKDRDKAPQWVERKTEEASIKAAYNQF